MVLALSPCQGNQCSMIWLRFRSVARVVVTRCWWSSSPSQAGAGEGEPDPAVASAECEVLDVDVADIRRDGFDGGGGEFEGGDAVGWVDADADSLRVDAADNVDQGGDRDLFVGLQRDSDPCLLELLGYGRQKTDCFGWAAVIAGIDHAAQHGRVEPARYVEIAAQMLRPNTSGAELQLHIAAAGVVAEVVKIIRLIGLEQGVIADLKKSHAEVSCPIDCQKKAYVRSPMVISMLLC
jgi:hypothetical protein